SSFATEFAIRRRGLHGLPRKLFALAQTGSFALEVAQIVKLGAAYATGTHYVNVINNPGIQREDTFHALSETNLANGDAFAHRHAVTRNHDPFESLEALFIAFLNFDVDFNCVAGAEFGKRLLPLILIDVLSQQRVLHDDIFSVELLVYYIRPAAW